MSSLVILVLVVEADYLIKGRRVEKGNLESPCTDTKTTILSPLQNLNEPRELEGRMKLDCLD